MNNWLNQIQLALLRIKDLEERVEALEKPKKQTGWGVLPSGEDAPDFDPILPPLNVVTTLEVVKRKPGRPRKNA